jgi:hypothetical protein
MSEVRQERREAIFSKAFQRAQVEFVRASLELRGQPLCGCPPLTAAVVDDT